MANKRHLELARQGKEVWNAWRRENPDERADFSGTNFTLPENRDISFAGFKFGDDADFSLATFGDNARFESAIFGDHTNFTRAVFGDGALFDKTIFEGFVDFSHARIGRKCRFSGTRFRGGCSFFCAVLEGTVRFHNFELAGECDFSGVKFLGDISFSDLNASNKNTRNTVIRFYRVIFESTLTFAGISGAREVVFAGARFKQPPDFDAFDYPGRLDWTGTQFSFGKRRFWPLRNWTTDSNVAVRIRRLRKIANDIHAHDPERDLFILERKAERGILWKQGWVARPRALGLIVLLFFYDMLSNCGRSVLLPVLWLAVCNMGFWHLYGSFARTAGKMAGNAVDFSDSILKLMVAGSVPFVGASRQGLADAVQTLFGSPLIPGKVVATLAAQAILNAALVFLFALALRHLFKVK